MGEAEWTCRGIDWTRLGEVATGLHSISEGDGRDW